MFSASTAATSPANPLSLLFWPKDSTSVASKLQRSLCHGCSELKPLKWLSINWYCLEKRCLNSRRLRTGWISALLCSVRWAQDLWSNPSGECVLVAVAKAFVVVKWLWHWSPVSLSETKPNFQRLHPVNLASAARPSVPRGVFRSQRLILMVGFFESWMAPSLKQEWDCSTSLRFSEGQILFDLMILG